MGKPVEVVLLPLLPKPPLLVQVDGEPGARCEERVEAAAGGSCARLQLGEHHKASEQQSWKMPRKTDISVQKYFYVILYFATLMSNQFPPAPLARLGCSGSRD